MTNREKLFHYLIQAVMIAAAVLGARYGIPIPPPVVTIPPPTDPPGGPVPIPPRSAEVGPNTQAAIGKIQFGSSGCSATVIGPRRSDGRYWVLTASHCVERVGQHGTMKLLDGRQTGIIVASLDRGCDCCWCYTESNSDVYPFAILARSSPPVGSRIWHAGYGVDKPGNREDGTVTAAPNSRGQLQFSLSVSSGDSGGGICMNDSGEVVSCVCCSSGPGRLADVWGACPECIRQHQPTAMLADDWLPIDMPQRPPKP